jgi:hypothetical protein
MSAVPLKAKVKSGIGFSILQWRAESFDGRLIEQLSAASPRMSQHVHSGVFLHVDQPRPLLNRAERDTLQVCFLSEAALAWE